MRLLLDTHALIWALYDPKKLPKKIIHALEDSTNSVYYSSISSLEIAIKIALKKLTLDLKALLSEASSIGFEEMPFLSTHGVTMMGLPSLHSDPFDRALVAQSIGENVTLVSGDSNFNGYPAKVIWR